MYLQSLGGQYCLLQPAQPASSSPAGPSLCFRLLRCESGPGSPVVIDYLAVLSHRANIPSPQLIRSHGIALLAQMRRRPRQLQAHRTPAFQSRRPTVKLAPRPWRANDCPPPPPPRARPDGPCLSSQLRVCDNIVICGTPGTRHPLLITQARAPKPLSRLLSSEGPSSRTPRLAG